MNRQRKHPIRRPLTYMIIPGSAGGIRRTRSPRSNARRLSTLHFGAGRYGIRNQDILGPKDHPSRYLLWRSIRQSMRKRGPRLPG